MNRHVEKVKEDIRSGRTELVWEEKGNPVVFFFDAHVLERYVFSLTEKGRVSLWEKIGERQIPRPSHPISKLLNEKQIEKDPAKNTSWPIIAPTLEETKTKLQSIYNDWLLSEARKKDEGEA